MIVTASAVESAVHQQRNHSESDFVDTLTATFSTLPAARFPNLAALGQEMTSGGGDERFRYAIDVFLAGLEARAAAGG